VDEGDDRASGRLLYPARFLDLWISNGLLNMGFEVIHNLRWGLAEVLVSN
jgi:hypothetical protein